MARMNSVVCDRCGVQWEDTGEGPFPDWVRIVVDLPQQESDDCEGFDVCVECAQKFASWMQEGKN